SWSSLMSCAGSSGIGCLLECGVTVNGTRGRVRPVVAAGNGQAPIERPAIPVYVGLDRSSAHPDSYPAAMILGSFRGVQRRPVLGRMQPIHLAADHTAVVRKGARIAAQIDQP